MFVSSTLTLHTNNKKVIVMSFKKFILERKITDDPEGDFVDDTKRATDFPEEFISFAGLQAYLEFKKADSTTIEAGRKLWREYKDLT